MTFDSEKSYSLNEFFSVGRSLQASKKVIFGGYKILLYNYLAFVKRGRKADVNKNYMEV